MPSAPSPKTAIDVGSGTVEGGVDDTKFPETVKEKVDEFGEAPSLAALASTKNGLFAGARKLNGCEVLLPISPK
jgi:hypothetical protein